MRIKKITNTIVSVMLIVLMVVSVSPINAFAAESGYQALSEGHTLVMQNVDLK